MHKWCSVNIHDDDDDADWLLGIRRDADDTQAGIAVVPPEFLMPHDSLLVEDVAVVRRPHSEARPPCGWRRRQPRSPNQH